MFKLFNYAPLSSIGSKTKEGVVQGVASGTRAVLMLYGGEGYGDPRGFCVGCPWRGKALGHDVVGKGGDLALNLSPNPSLLQWLRKPRSRHPIWEELCSLGLGTLRQPRAW